MIEKPESPHDLVPFWPDIDETQLASVGAQYGKLSATATQALNKSRGDSKELNGALVEGFDTQVNGVLLVGGQHSKVAEFDSQSAGVIADAAVAFTEAKTQIVATTHAYEAMISVREFEIQLLTASPMFGALGGEYKRARIDQLKREIEQLIKAARKMNDARYEGIMPPAEPANPGLTPLKNHAPAGPSDHFEVKPIDNGHRDGPKSPGDTHALDSRRSSQRDPLEKDGPSKATPDSHVWEKQRNPEVTEKNSSFGAQNTPGVGNAASSGDVMSKASSSLPTSIPSAPSGGSNPVSSLSSGGGLTSMLSKGGSMPSVPSSGNVGSGLSGLGSPASSAGGLNPAQQFLSGAAQGFTQSSPSTASAASAAAQSFKPPPASTMPSAPVNAAVTPSSVPASGPQTVTAAPSNVGAVPPAAVAGGVPLTAPPPAGVPAAPAAPPPAAAVVPPGGGGGGAVSGPPPVPQPPSVMNMGAKTAAMKAFQVGHQATGEGLRATPEFSAAMALVSALNDPERPAGSLITGGWSVAVFNSGSSVRFVAAERHGLSWIPAGVYLPAGVSIAHLDTRVPADIRASWRGMEPSALVLAEYARAIGEQPSIVVARAYHSGLPGWFDRQVVVVADETDHVIIPNPLHEPKGRHRLELAAPEHWQWVMSVPEEHIEAEVREVAAWLVEQHDHMFANWPDNDEMAKLRAVALAQVGREGGSTDVAKLLAGRMGELASRLMGTPLYGTPQWTTHTYSEMLLRGWETLLLGLGASSRTVLADMQYAALMATQTVLPPPVEAVA
ncbi:hypothetical protein [Mycobacteroides abscessus]|nr:hypothetical protein [Mycobacteroides abscessus]SID72073.1 Uncharacterised protein [Mycobacteroides abscessus subsp. abscessus]SIK18574.1 Uncharacterised protein [Mycobacteroides abscessus subsp. abscessus]SIM42950.1 Uncharacterised protein [Mycobacteroides abscessus subsp. abscessus]SKM12668.1 Uncharacterised protein [Mycobacteroides abscessus subsp. massiliense]SKM88784.1 Uncharacterised protein [Mycobacteroides abscessus subsp. massiliense]